MALLSDLSDKQNMLLTQLSYGSNILGKKEYKDKTLAEVKIALKEIDTSKMTKSEKEEVKTLKSIFNDLDNEFLESVKIKAVENDSKTGFGAVSFTDDSGNVGFSYRGTDDFDIKKLLKKSNLTNVDMIDNVKAMMTGKSRQSEQALAFFNKNKDMKGNNFLYGHSKGGELAEFVYVHSYDFIRGMHTLNAQPINPYSLTPEQRRSLSLDKADMIVNNGDLVWMTGKIPSYNIRFAQTKDGDKHSHKTIVYDDNEMIVIATSEDFMSNPDYVRSLYYASQYFLGNIQKMYFVRQYINMCVKSISYFAKNNMQTKIDELIEMSSSQLRKAGVEFDEIADKLKVYLGFVASGAMEVYNKDFKNVNQYTEQYRKITVDTYKLKLYVQRLQSVNRRISALNNSMNLLYWKSGLLDLWKLRQANILQAYASRLTQCTSYLNDTATDFEIAEANIINNL